MKIAGGYKFAKVVWQKTTIYNNKHLKIKKLQHA